MYALDSCGSSTPLERCALETYFLVCVFRFTNNRCFPSCTMRWNDCKMHQYTDSIMQTDISTLSSLFTIVRPTTTIHPTKSTGAHIQTLLLHCMQICCVCNFDARHCWFPSVYHSTRMQSLFHQELINRDSMIHVLAKITPTASVRCFCYNYIMWQQAKCSCKISLKSNDSIMTRTEIRLICVSSQTLLGRWQNKRVV